jgi:SH3-like domain-containing protein
MNRLICSTLLLLSLLVSYPVHAEDNDKARQPKLPRFATLASPEVNLRTGPGTRYPIDWVVRRKGLPVEIVQQFEHWRDVRTVDGTTGWVHKVMLNDIRSLIVKGTEPQMMFAQPDLKTRVQAQVEPAVLGRLQRCQKHWCQVKIQGYEGWMAKDTFWGAYPDERFDD